MNVRPIRTEEDHKWALEQIEPYFENEPEIGSPESDRLEVLVTLIEAYEDRVCPIEPVEPYRIVRFFMEQNGYTQTDLAELLGSRSRASEILAGKRNPSKKMAERLSDVWGMPLESIYSSRHRHAA